jgi:hypothetical protein
VRVAGDLEFDDIVWLRTNSRAWRLLRADNAPLVLSFLHRVFIEENIRAIPAAELASRLDDQLYALNERGPRSFPRPAREYLDEWASPESGWLRKYYPEGSDEPHYDATPAVERALQWVAAQRDRDFVGTESRLNTIFDLLRQIVFGTEADPAAKIEELRRQQHLLEEEIARIEAGQMVMLDQSGVRDRYQQFAAMARELLADFRQVEENFRTLDRRLRRRSRGGRAARETCWMTCSAAASRSPALTRAGRSRRSTTSCCQVPASRSCPGCSTGCTSCLAARRAIPGCGGSTMTGCRPPGPPRRRSGSCPSNCAGSSMTRCGSRTAG